MRFSHTVMCVYCSNLGCVQLLDILGHPEAYREDFLGALGLSSNLPWERLCAPRARTAYTACHGVTLWLVPSPHTPLYLEKDDRRARTACTTCTAFPMSSQACVDMISSYWETRTTGGLSCGLPFFLVLAHSHHTSASLTCPRAAPRRAQ